MRERVREWKEGKLSLMVLTWSFHCAVYHGTDAVLEIRHVASPAKYHCALCVDAVPMPEESSFF